MGLDIVNLFMRVEEHFDIDIPDSVAGTLETVGSLHQAILVLLAQRGVNRDPDTVFNELRQVICEETRVKPTQVVADARFVRDLRLD